MTLNTEVKGFSNPPTIAILLVLDHQINSTSLRQLVQSFKESNSICFSFIKYLLNQINTSLHTFSILRGILFV